METTEEIKQERIKLLQELKEIAKKNNITQQQIADDTGLLQSNINRIFSAKYSPSIDLILLISKAIKARIKVEG